MKLTIPLILILYWSLVAARRQQIGLGKGRNEEGLRVQATGVASGRPDAVNIQFSITSVKETNQEALKVVSATARSIRTALGALVTDEKYQSTQLHTSPEHKYDKKQGESVLIGYRASQSYTLIVKGIDNQESSLAERSSSAVGKIVQAGGNEVKVNSVTPIILDKDKIAKQAREAAVKNALEKGNHYAQLLGTSLGTVSYVNEIHAPEARGHDMMLRSRANFAAAEMASDALPDVSIDLGEKETRVSVEIKWNLGVESSNS